jgi:hypothetical protein
MTMRSYSLMESQLLVGKTANCWAARSVAAGVDIAVRRFKWSGIDCTYGQYHSDCVAINGSVPTKSIETGERAATEFTTPK